VIVQAKGYDESRGENLSVLYYFEHNSIEDLRVELVNVTETWIDATVTGSAVVNGSNGIDPDARLSVRSRFIRDSNLRRSFT